MNEKERWQRELAKTRRLDPSSEVLERAKALKTQSPIPSGPPPRRGITIAAAVAIAALGFVGIWRAIASPSELATTNPTTTSSSSSQPLVSVSRMLAASPGVRCTASMPSVLQPGAPIGLTFTLENRSSHPIDVSTFPPLYPVRITAADGTISNTADLMAHSWPGEVPASLSPGETKTVEAQSVRVQFPGPLTVKPTCADEQMEPLAVGVDDGGAAVSDDEAVSRAAGATSGLLDTCRPSPGGSVVGSIAPPSAADASPLTLDVRCSAMVAAYDGFSVVTFVISTPSDVPTPTVPLGLLSNVDLPSAHGNAETIVWRFVVTDSSVTPVASTNHTETAPAGNAMDVSYEVSSNGWTGGDQSRCGSEDYSWGGDGRSVTVTFLTPCVAGQ